MLGTTKMEINVFYVHRNYPKDMMKVVVFKARHKYEYPLINTPHLTYEEVDLDKATPLLDSDTHLVIKDSHLFDKLMTPYFNNIEETTPTDLETLESGAVTNFDWLDNVGDEILLGGAFLDGCMRNGIRSIQDELFRRGEKKKLVLIPQVTLCWNQPGNIAFMENLKDINETLYIPSTFRGDDFIGVQKDISKVVI